MTNKKTKKRNVLYLRFSGFYENWQMRKLGECSHSFDYGMNAAATTFDGKNKYIRITDIDEASSKYKSDNLVSPLGDLEEKFLVKKNDILFASVMSNK